MIVKEVQNLLLCVILDKIQKRNCYTVHRNFISTYGTYASKNVT